MSAFSAICANYSLVSAASIAVFAGAGAGSTASATTIAVAATYTAGDAILVWVNWKAQTGTATVTDGTNTFTQVGATLLNTDNHFSSAVFYCPLVASAGAATITATFDASQLFRAIQYFRVKNASTTLAASLNGNFQLTPGPGTAADAVTSGSVTPNQQPAALVGISINHVNGSTINAGTAFTALGTMSAYNSLESDQSQTEWKRITSTAATAATFTSTSSTEEFDTLAVVIYEK